MQSGRDSMIRQFTLCVFVLLTISLTRYSHVAGTGIEILGFGVRPVGGGMTGPGSLPEDLNGPERGGFAMSDGGNNGNGISGRSDMGLGISSGPQPEGRWGSSMEGGGGGGESPGFGAGLGGSQSGPGGVDTEGSPAPNGMDTAEGGGMPASLGLGPAGAPLGTNNLEGGGDQGGPIGFGLGAGGPFESGGGGVGGEGGGSPLARLAAGFRGSSLGSRGGNMEGSGGDGALTGFGGGFGGPMLGSRSGGLEGPVASGSNERGAGREVGGASSNLGPGFRGSPFGSGGGSSEGGRISGEARPPPGGFSGSGSGNGGGGFGGAGLSSAGISDGRFGSGELGGGRGGGGGGFGIATSNGGYGGPNMPLRLPPQQGTPEQQPASRQSSEENGEGEGEGGGGSGSREGTSSRRSGTFTGLLNLNALRSIVGAGPGALVGTGVSLLQGTRTGRRVERRGRRILTRLTRQHGRLSRTLGERGNRRRRSVPLNVKAPSSTTSPNFIDYVPDHVKMVHCGHNEVPNRGHYKDRFCHPEATWKAVMRMRPDCVCAPGYIRNSWGDCISYAECYHCMDKHHLNMDYNLCESQCPLVCNQPLDRNCPDTCYEECACRPGYIRSHRNGPCISIRQCLPGCSSRNQNFTLCRSPCPATCANPFPSNCPKYCAGEGCICKPGFLALHLEPLVCVRPEQCPGFRGTCRGKNQLYTTCMSRCPATCWDKEPRMCPAVCSGTGCVCKPGFVISSSNPLVCVHPAQCAAFKNTSNFIHT